MPGDDAPRDDPAVGAADDETVSVPRAEPPPPKLAWSEVDDGTDTSVWAAPPKRMGDGKRWALAAAAIVAALIVGAVLNTTGKKHQPPADASPPGPPLSSASGPPMQPTMSTGAWYRIDDCLLCDARPPGTYETEGAVDVDTMTPCSWRRTTRPSDDLSYLIGLGKVDAGNGRARVDLERGDYFYSRGCHVWRLVHRAP